jgi:hypothetical protein
MEWTTEDDQQLADAIRRHDAGEDVRARPGETTVPDWAMAAIVLGLVALTGSLFIVVVVVAFGSVWWLQRAADGLEPRARTTGRADGGSFGGPAAWL